MNSRRKRVEIQMGRSGYNLRLAIRGFRNGVKVFEEEIEADGTAIGRIAQHHMKLLWDGTPGCSFMVEVEFLDEPDLNQRYFRFGTDPSGMVKPIRIDLDKLT